MLCNIPDTVNAPAALCLKVTLRRLFVLLIKGNIEIDVIVDIGGMVLTYLLTPWSRVLLEKLAGFQLVKKFPEF